MRRRWPERRPARRARRHQAAPLGLAPPRKAKPQPSLIAHRNRWTSLLAASAKSDPQPGIEPGSPSNSRTRSESRLNGTGAQGTTSRPDEHRSLVPDRIAKAQRMPCTTGPGPGSATITATGTAYGDFRATWMIAARGSATGVDGFRAHAARARRRVASERVARRRRGRSAGRCRCLARRTRGGCRGRRRARAERRRR